MSQDAASQKALEEQQMQELLTMKALGEWADRLGFPKLIALIHKDKELSLKEIYLKEHGLPLSSKIEGL